MSGIYRTQQCCIVNGVTEDHRPRGRQRDARTDRALIDAVLDLVGEGATLSGLSLVAIAERAGVSRNSLYRRWKTKDALYLDVLASVSRPVPPPRNENVRDDIVEILIVIAERAGDRRGAQMMRQLHAEASTFPELQRRYLDEVVAPRRAALLTVLHNGIERGELDASIDRELTVDLLVSPLLVQAWSGARIDPDPRGTCERLYDQLLHGMSPAD